MALFWRFLGGQTTVVWLPWPWLNPCQSTKRDPVRLPNKMSIVLPRGIFLKNDPTHLVFELNNCQVLVAKIPRQPEVGHPQDVFVAQRKFSVTIGLADYTCLLPSWLYWTSSSSWPKFGGFHTLKHRSFYILVEHTSPKLQCFKGRWRLTSDQTCFLSQKLPWMIISKS